MVLSGAAALVPSTAALAADKPNIVFILTDNLGYGEIGAYGGGITRGAATPRIDSCRELTGDLTSSRACSP
jgi:arylsulfatase